MTTTVCPAVSAQAADSPRYTSAGSLLFPANYREWVFLSSGLGMTYGPLASASSAEHPSFDNVFVHRAAYQAFLKTGAWPEKTMFVLEVRSSQSKGSINQGGHFQSDIAGIEVEVKDGGKWTFFGFGQGVAEAKPFARTESCYACHAQNGAVDNTFVQFYPTLLPVAKEKKTFIAR
ncbi:MAG: cytochrome P460 family protein [Acidobacteriota bacterium]